MLQNFIARCPIIGHEGSPIIGLCLYNECQLQLAVCNYCKLQDHTNHVGECYLMNDVFVKVTEYLNELEAVKLLFSKIEKQHSDPQYTQISQKIAKVKLKDFDWSQPLTINIYHDIAQQINDLKQLIFDCQALLNLKQEKQVDHKVQKGQKKVKTLKQQQKQQQIERIFTYDQSSVLDHNMLIQNHLAQCYHSSGEVFLKPDISNEVYSIAKIVFEVVQCQGILGIGIRKDIPDKNMICLYSNGEIKQPNQNKVKAYHYPKWQPKDLITVEICKSKYIQYLIPNYQPIRVPIDKNMNCSLYCYIQDAIIIIQSEQWN